MVFFFFSISAGSCDVLTRIELPVLSLLVNAGCIVRTTASCDTDVGDVRVAVLDELVDKPGTTSGTYFSVLHFARLPSLISCGFWPLVHS